MNKLEKINELAEKIKYYTYGISDIRKNIDIDLEHFEEDKEELFIRLEIDRNSIRFEIDKNGEFYIETSLNNFKILNDLTFWETMYIVSNR
ncbi:hypothetical protein MWG07_00460 [Fusobacterium necrophorum]|uniref:Uncharacterized protein n=2 Tax=Fusobacterium necrophorum TaxID=859 RepID=A0A162J1Q9_9FUSO|nr:hypothetical protein [Fusobacterium necrophorum]KYL04885.1 hypothetical protein A2J07_09805 [Fusobacterium necrophorum subsp. funduliforme]MDK4479948.1 hypothetical protein [Fusobacterium necrophorum]MDK4510737.1 hypothetical protein [Fusobacterium necrophorum]